MRGNADRVDIRINKISLLVFALVQDISDNDTPQGGMNADEVFEQRAPLWQAKRRREEAVRSGGKSVRCGPFLLLALRPVGGQLQRTAI